jgi:hypothetical protein
MGPYSHIIVANLLESFLKPENPKEYYWGAIAPDARYLIKGMSRTQTHLSSAELLVFMERFPYLVSFLQGYLVHCLTDQLDLPELLQGKFPSSSRRHKLSPQQCTVIMEFFNILRTKPISEPISETHNLILREIGIDEEQALRFARAMNQYLPSPSLISIFTLYRNLRMGGNARIEKYSQAIRQFQRNRFRRHMIFCGLNIGDINQDIASRVEIHLPKEVLSHSIS